MKNFYLFAADYFLEETWVVGLKMFPVIHNCILSCLRFTVMYLEYEEQCVTFVCDEDGIY